jgi:hypothetical protein
MKSNVEKIWNCKCKCVSKYAHKARWAFVSKSKKRYSSKYDNLKILNENTSSNLVKKLLLKKTNSKSNIESSQVILVKKVRYDEKKKQIIVDETVDNNIDGVTNKTNKTNKSTVLIEKDLIELKDLFNM